MEMTEKLKKLDRMYGQARLKEAEEALLQWLKEALMEGDTGAELAIYNELEGLYRTTKRAEEAVQISKKAISLAERMGLAGTAIYGTTLLNAATANRAVGNMEAALGLYQDSADIFRSLGKDGGYEMASLYNNISHIYQAQGKHEQDLVSLEQALALVTTMENSEAECAVTRTGMSLSLMALGRFGEAEKKLEEALVWYESPAGRFDAHYGAALSAAGELAYRKGDLTKAIRLLEQALEVTRNIFGENDDCMMIRRNLEQLRQQGLRQ